MGHKHESFNFTNFNHKIHEAKINYMHARVVRVTKKNFKKVFVLRLSCHYQIIKSEHEQNPEMRQENMCITFSKKTKLMD